MLIASLPCEGALGASSESSARLAEALRDPACYPHPAAEVTMRETHISYVLLAGEFAYKVKKPVRLPFLDFSTLEARRHWCLEELRLNARFAPELYLDVVPITPGPRVSGPGKAIEYAVRMKRFPAGALLCEHATAGTLSREHVDALALRLASFHAAAPRCERAPDRGRRWAGAALDNFREMQALAPAHAARLDALRAWTEREAGTLAGAFGARAATGFERDCHGDLHLANVALVDGKPLMFDCIEFSAAWRNTDTAADVAFLTMDLERHGLAGLRARFLDRYLEASGDHAMLAVLRFYEVYRAMVRAKVALLGGARAGFDAYLATGERLSLRAPPALVLMQGLSGSGKTVVSGELLEATGAIRLRSDVERKRLHGLTALERARAAPGAGIYNASAGRETYERLETLARVALAAGYAVIVDATFLRRADRDRFRVLAGQTGAAFQIAACTASAGVLRERVARRERGGDASDAGIAVLEEQLGRFEPLDGEEGARATVIDTGDARARERAVRALARRMGTAT